MALNCSGCGNVAAYHVSLRMDDTSFMETCNRCGVVGSSWTPDVYWPGSPYKSENILDKNGEPILLTSRRHKAEVMREQHLSEAGDRHHGSRADFLNHMIPKKQSNTRAEVQAAIDQAKKTLHWKYNR